MAARAEDIFDQIETPIGGVPPEMVMSVWHKVEPMLRRAVRDDCGYTMDSLLNEIQMARIQLWVIDDFKGVVCTMIKVNPPPVKPVLWVQFLAGQNMDDWLSDWKEVMEAFAIANGCGAVEFAGRKGWNKIHEKHREYKPKWTIFRRNLDG